MWKRDEVVRPPVSGREPTGTPAPGAPTVPGGQTVHAPEIEAKRHMDKDVVNIGKSVVIKGELNGSEDLTVEGNVEGKIELREHVLTIGPHGKIKAEVFAKAVIVLGEVMGNITASEKVDIRDNGSVDGNIVSPRVAIAEGAHFRGSVDMQRKPAAATAPAQPAKPEVKPAPPAPAATQTPSGQRFGV
jgi:cytoskeletal protein CcmA (bactofilin family)